MSVDYQCFFEPTSLDRSAIVHTVSPIVTMSGVQFDKVIYELEWREQLQEFAHTNRYLKALRPEDLPAETNEWLGISLEYSGRHGDRSLVTWLDRQEERHVVSIVDSSSVFAYVNADTDAWHRHEEFLVDVAETLRSQFFVYIANPDLRTVRSEDAEHFLRHSLPGPPGGRDVVLVGVHRRFPTAWEEPLEREGSGLSIRLAGDYTLIRDAYYDPGPKY